MQKLIIAVSLAILIIPATVLAQEDFQRFEVAAEVGNVYLTDPVDQYLDNAPGYGLTLGYNFSPHVGLHLPVLVSVHEDDGLEGDRDARLTMVSAIPSLRWQSGKKFNVWFSYGMGAIAVDSTLEEGDAEAENTETAFATALRTGVDYYFMKNHFAGLAWSVQTAALEEEKLAGQEKWEIYTYYTATLRLGYAF